MSYNNPILSEEESIFSRYIELQGNPLLPVTPGTCIGKALRLPHFYLTSEIGNEEEDLNQSHNYSIDTATDKIYATALGILYVDNNKIVVRPILYPANDGMTVYADVYHRDFKGNSLLLSHYAAALWQLDVNAPIDTARFNSAARKAMTQGHPVRMVPICKGRPPTHEEPPIILPLLPERILRTMQKSSAPVDYKDQGFFAEVPAHTPIAVQLPAPESSNGFDVFGNALPVMEQPTLTTNETRMLSIGKNLYGIPQHDGHTVYYSSCKGLMSIRDDILSITDVLRIEGDVNMKTGNIIAQQGSVHITGSITPGFTVQAQQHVIIDGNVDQGNITCGGDVFVSGAIIMNKNSTITSRGSVYANHMHNADVVAAHSIVTSGSIVNSELTAGNSIRTCSEKGTVLGSTLVAGSEINIAGAGGENGAPPILIITNEASSPNALRKITSEAETVLSQSISKLDDWIRRSQEKELSGSMRHRADKLLEKAKRIRKSIANRVTPRVTHSAHRIIIRGTVAAGTLVTMHGQTLTIEHPLPKLSMELENHQRAVRAQQVGH
ncbi:DUF342 domain-containing protein [Halodesulfovibrio marinisediminis]|uniref:Flagellar Assembly Protein A N-terminal region domain-containing protein n=1 Tax=Halodesulfovibrio marinisediminis DSM 17456 TaxID=1121457 RepID=A0A1N6FNV4_9BACT|nr:FapA family protein [Halodesulfovibrio marinisediminis]SIN96987.1 Protein of unknown function [Halodesulfovibrio marinisediminis DSM 17456]